MDQDVQFVFDGGNGQFDLRRFGFFHQLVSIPADWPKKRATGKNAGLSLIEIQTFTDAGGNVLSRSAMPTLPQSTPQPHRQARRTNQRSGQGA